MLGRSYAVSVCNPKGCLHAELEEGVLRTASAMEASRQRLQPLGFVQLIGFCGFRFQDMHAVSPGRRGASCG